MVSPPFQMARPKCGSVKQFVQSYPGDKGACWHLNPRQADFKGSESQKLTSKSPIYIICSDMGQNRLFSKIPRVCLL